MTENTRSTVIWTKASMNHAINIRRYLKENFSDTEVNSFFELLNAFEEAISYFPKLYPTSRQKTRIRRAVISRELSAFYRIRKNQIEVLALIDNRCDLAKWL
ncbi:MAG: type II toxin-antitoxin system RelE/ParE family toxin [Flavobacteriales bacterium]|nr:type II toxin-antitoxin system RelE/ParE family toxin [Flavobacteriales bacterium]